jgi:predicted kinase
MSAPTRGGVLLLIGPVGAGKSTYARRVAARESAVFLDLDTWMVRLFGEDPRPAQGVLEWYLQRRERCRAVLWDTARDIADAGGGVVLELGLVTRDEREAAYQAVVAADLDLSVVLVDAPRDARRERVAARNEEGGAYTQVVPPLFFEKASDAWQPPSEQERRTWAIRDAVS